MIKIKFLFFFLYFPTTMITSGSAMLKYNATDSKIVYDGRYIKTDSSVTLVSSASSATMHFSGNSCIIHLINLTPNGMQNYLALELDGRYIGRKRITGRGEYSINLDIEEPKDDHILKVFKATEAQNGNFSISAFSCYKLLAPVKQSTKKLSIEFIGDSHTCGQGIDHEEIPCNTDQWYDQHNGYLTYASLLARKLNMHYTISAVSGIGIYRNWNGIGPVMPEVYANTNFNLDSTKKWDFTKFVPDIVCICLGTNDFSDGDGINERRPFSSDTFISSYISFIKTLREQHPAAKFLLLTSVSVAHETQKNEIFIQCLKKIINHFQEDDNFVMDMFEFPAIEIHGCDYHPDGQDHLKMADLLESRLLTIIKRINHDSF